jgi:hypothetical protein
MNPAVLVFAQVAVISAGLVGTICAISVATFKAVRKTERAQRPLASGVAEQLAQLQQSVDAIAIEVERIAEAQRFTARLEAGREDRPVLPSPR